MPLPNGILFEESYVLAISVEPYRVVCAMDFLLTPEHPMYYAPRIGERACFHRGRIEIGNFRRISWDATGYTASTDANGEVDFGTLDDFAKIGDAWKLSGDWGDLVVSGGEISISIDSQETRGS